MDKEEILERMEKTLKEWDNIVREHEGEIRKALIEDNEIKFVNLWNPS